MEGETFLSAFLTSKRLILTKRVLLPIFNALGLYINLVRDTSFNSLMTLIPSMQAVNGVQSQYDDGCKTSCLLVG